MVSSSQNVPSQQKILQEALSHHKANRFVQAESLYRQILLRKPDHPDALHMLGWLNYQKGQIGSAVKMINKALAVNPELVEAYINLGFILKKRGKVNRAIACYRRALTLRPDFVPAHLNLGNVFREQGRLDEAIAIFRRAISLNPDYAKAYLNLGNALSDQDKLDEAIVNYRRALSIKPDFIDVHLNLGNAFKKQDKIDEAVGSYRQALAIKPDYALAHLNIGNIFSSTNKLKEATACFKRAATLKPDFAEAYYNLGNVFREQGKFGKAIGYYRRALDVNRSYVEAHSNLLFTLNYVGKITQEAIHAEALNWYEQHGKPLFKQDLVYKNDRNINRKLRIGYVSPDFRQHSVAYFFEPLLKAHKKENIEVFCYSNLKEEDYITKRLQAEADHWFPILKKTNEEIAAKIRRDKIDILVDLAGHTRKNNLLVFAYKPAPIQVTWLGYPNTTGMQTIDYRFTDSIADPQGETDAFYSEKLFRLEHGFLCYQPPDSTPEVGALPCRHSGRLTFGSFNNLAKVTGEVVKAWAGILHAVPESSLLLKSKQFEEDQNKDRLKEMFAREGIFQERLEMHNNLPEMNDHLNLYNMIDIGLDPFPYNGTTTTCEALWMGVPVIIMLGDRHAARVGASIMKQIGLEELVAHSLDEYIDLAVSLANSRDRLLDIRNSLRQKMQESQLMDNELFAETVENAYRQMWKKWCAEVS